MENKHRGLRADRLKWLREARGWSQQKLNDLCLFTTGQVTRYENGLSDPLPPQLSQLAKVLDVTSDYLIGLSDDPEEGRKEQMSNTEKTILLKFRNKDYYGAISDIATHAKLEDVDKNNSTIK